MFSSLSPSDSGSSVGGGGGEAEWTQEQMAQAIKINEEIQRTGMYFA